MDLDTVAIMDQAEFERGFQRVSKIVLEDSIVPAERYVLVDAFDNEVTLRSTNGHMQIRHSFNANVVNRSFFGLNVGDMNKRIKFLAGDTLEVRRVNDEEVSFHGGGVNMSLKHLSVYNYPTDRTLDLEPLVSFQSKSFNKALQLITPGVNNTLTDITGAMMMRIEAGRVVLETANRFLGVSRAIVPIEPETPLSEPYTLYVPHAAANLWNDLYSGSSLSVKVDGNGNVAAFSWGNTTLSCSLLYGDWPNVDPVYQLQPIASAILPAEDLVGILGLIVVNHEKGDSIPLAQMRFTGESVHIEGVKGDGAAYADIRGSDVQGKKVRVKVNVKQLQSVVKYLGKRIFVGITENGFIRIQAPGDDSYVYVASPVGGSFGVEE